MTDFGVVVVSTPCRWCSETASCHAYRSPFDACACPAHTNDYTDKEYGEYICRASNYPFKIGDFSGSDTDAVLAWTDIYLGNAFGDMHPYQTYQDERANGVTGIVDMDQGVWKLSGKSTTETGDGETIRIALASDWGSGTIEAAAVASLMAAFDPHYTMHLGDIYYEALAEEIQSNVLGQAPSDYQQGVAFPHGSLGTFYFTGNHEMLSRGFGYFDTLLPTGGLVSDPDTAQPTSFVGLENEHWRVIGLDSGYNSYEFLGTTDDWISGVDQFDQTDCKQPDEAFAWLRDVVRLQDACSAEDPRGIVLLSHHQYFSDFYAGSAYNGTAKQLAELIPADCPVLWFWGHEHRLEIYDLSTTADGIDLSVFARNIGNGGFPQGPDTPSKHTGLLAYDDRVYKTLQMDLAVEKSEEIYFNGFATLAFSGANLTVEYRTFACDVWDGDSTCAKSSGPSFTESTLLASESFSVGAGGKLAHSSLSISGSMTNVDSSTALRDPPIFRERKTTYSPPRRVSGSRV